MLKKEKLYLGSLAGIMLFNLLLVNCNFCFRWGESLIQELCLDGTFVLDAFVMFWVSVELFSHMKKFFSKKKSMYVLTLALTIFIGTYNDIPWFYFSPGILKIIFLLLVGYVLPYVIKEKDYFLGAVLGFALLFMIFREKEINLLYYVCILSLSLYVNVGKKNRKWIILGVIGVFALLTVFNFPYICERLLGTYTLYIDKLMYFYEKCEFIGYTRNLRNIYETLYDEGLSMVVFTGVFGLFTTFFVLLANIKLVLMSKERYVKTNNNFIKFIILAVNMIIILGLFTSLFFPSEYFRLFGTNITSDVFMLLSLYYLMKKGNNSHEEICD